MTRPMPDTDPLKREPPGASSKVPDLQREPGIDVPAEPGRPAPYPENPDLPGDPPQPVDPGPGQPVPPEVETAKRRR